MTSAIDILRQRGLGRTKLLTALAEPLRRLDGLSTRIVHRPGVR
jgi:hypothetical protein